MKTLFLLALFLSPFCFYLYFYAAKRTTLFIRPNISTVESIAKLFPSNKADIESRKAAAMKDALMRLESIYALQPMQRTFDNTMRAFDVALEWFLSEQSAFYLLTLVSPDKEVRKTAEEAFQEMQNFVIDQFSLNTRLYNACVEYETLYKDSALTCQLNREEKYFIEETMRDFRRSGLGLPLERHKKIKKIQKELSEHALRFSVNIASSNSSIEVKKEDLKGLDDSFINALKKTEKGTYILGMDYPTRDKVLNECEVATTRKAFYGAFMQRGYPDNEQELAAVICLRDELATELGYASFAHLDIDNKMAKTPEHVERFLAQLRERADKKTAQEMSLLKKDVPLTVVLTDNGAFNPWDIPFIRNYYKKKYLDIDESALSEYFPVIQTLSALLEVYEQFLGVTFKKVVEPPVLWHKDVEWVAVYKNGTYVGMVLLDLFPRPFKYTHAGELAIVPAVKTVKGTLYPSVVIVIANFPPAQDDRPGLLRRDNAITFFHEFGHALHSLLGATELASLSGTNTKGDFVEMPSQMLEEWMWDPMILKQITAHYKTKEPLPDKLIEKIVAMKNFESGESLSRGLFFSTMALAYFGPGAQKDLYGLWKDLHLKLRKHMYFEPTNYGYCNFTHLMDYGASYYGYVWSKVFALDLFYHIKPFGLLDKAIGECYVHEVIGRGGSEDPEKLLKNFLGREPNVEAFFKDLGL